MCPAAERDPAYLGPAALAAHYRWLANATRSFSDRCIAGIEANEARCRDTVEQSLALATALAPVIGYDRAAEISKEAHRTGRTVQEVAEEWDVLPPEELDVALDAYRMTGPGLAQSPK